MVRLIGAARRDGEMELARWESQCMRWGEGTGVAARTRKRWQAQEQSEVWALRRGEARRGEGTVLTAQGRASDGKRGSGRGVGAAM